MATLSKQHAINSLLDEHYLKKAISYYLLMGSLTNKQYFKVKSLIVDSNNHLNKVNLFFYKCYKELSFGFWLVNNFSNCFSFYILIYKVIHKDTESINSHIHSLNKILKDFFLGPSMILVISDIIIKNNITTSISHIHSG